MPSTENLDSGNTNHLSLDIAVFCSGISVTLIVYALQRQYSAYSFILIGIAVLIQLLGRFFIRRNKRVNSTKIKESFNEIVTTVRGEPVMFIAVIIALLQCAVLVTSGVFGGMLIVKILTR